MINLNNVDLENIPSAFNVIEAAYVTIYQKFNKSWFNWILSRFTTLGWFLNLTPIDESSIGEFSKFFFNSNFLVQSIFLFFLSKEMGNSLMKAMAIYRFFKLHEDKPEFDFEDLQYYPNNILDHKPNRELLSKEENHLYGYAFELYQTLKLKPEDLAKLLKFPKDPLSKGRIRVILDHFKEINFNFNAHQILEIDAKRIETIYDLCTRYLLNTTIYQLVIENKQELLTEITSKRIKNFDENDYQMFQRLGLEPRHLSLLVKSKENYTLLEEIVEKCKNPDIILEMSISELLSKNLEQLIMINETQL